MKISENEAKIQELKAKHGQIELVELKLDGEVDGDEFVVRPPAYVEFLRFIDESQGGEVAKSAAITNFVMPCVVWPEATDLRTLIEKKPGYLVKLSVELQAMAGQSTKAKRKKL